MHDLIQQLANNESVLLMYLADELPLQDRVEVEAMLARDPAMQRELEQLRESNAKAMETLAMLDAVDPMKISDSTTIRRTSRTIRQWQVDRAAATSQQPRVPKLRYPWWAYPAVSVAAASVLLVFLLWWSNGQDNPTIAEQPTRGDFMEWRSQRIADSIELTFGAGEEAKEELAMAEDELASLSQPKDNAEVGSFGIDANTNQ